MNGPIAVLAGTPVDTRMGVAYLEERGLPGVPFPLSRGPREQTAFQHAPAADKRRQALAVLRGAMAQGCRRAFVYCNSLSAAVDFPGLAEETGMRIVTPLDVYRRLAPCYRALGVIAANAQGLSGIEKVLLEANPALDLLGACALPVVLAVEAGMPPEELVERHRLVALAAWFADGGMEALVLGCTHFPYFKEALAARTGLPLVDLYSVGEMLVDFLPGSEPGSYIRNAGGAPANVAIAAARNGLEAAMCCSVGDDDFGRYLLGTLRENRVRCIRREPCREAVTTMAFVSLTEEGERSFTFVRKPGADMFLREEDVREADIRDTVIVHAGSCSLSASPAAEATAKALHLGREMGRLVSFDVNYRDMMWNGSQEACAAKVREILPDVDLLKISEEEADMLGGEAELPALMERYGLTLVVLTLGGQGARGYFRGRRLAVPGRRAHCADATGAGDAFWGGMLSQMRFRGVTQAEQLTEPLVQEALEYGNVSGWLCVQGRGAIPSLPTRQEIERHLV